jgi:hypothetical protein
MTVSMQRRESTRIPFATGRRPNEQQCAVAGNAYRRRHHSIIHARRMSPHFQEQHGKYRHIYRVIFCQDSAVIYVTIIDAS